jgi:biopolymer transport protein ExbD
MADLARDLRDVLASRAEKTVLVRASGGVGYAHVVDVLDTARAAGAERIGLVPDGVVTPPAPGR